MDLSQKSETEIETLEVGKFWLTDAECLFLGGIDCAFPI
jgi:hypothetical protein